MLTKLTVLKNMEIGERVAEDEADELEKYFVQTDQWQQMVSGQVDVVYGPKGSGKSALYTLLNRKEGQLFDNGILLASAENVRGATVFRTIVADPPPSEISFIYLWKIYNLTIIARTLRDYEINNDEAKSLVESLEKVGLLPTSKSLTVIFRAVTDYFKGWINRDTKAIEYALTIDSQTGNPTITRKTEFAATSEEQNLGEIPVEELFEVADKALHNANLKIWLLFDRLDVAFADSLELERNALRALFRAYSDLKAYSSLKIKIFVRDDIWQRITVGGFTEASHVTKAMHIKWTDEGLLNLIMLRLLNNTSIIDYAGVDPEEIKSDYNKQDELFYTLAPRQIDTGNNPDTFKWMLSRTMDSSASPVPREVIHLLEVAKDNQIQKLERGGEEPPEKQLFERAAFKEALQTVSKVRYEQTLLAEHPDMLKFLEKLDGEKSEQTASTLAKLWDVDELAAREIAKKLADFGFFDIRGSKEEPSYWVPFLYRHALNLVQGRA